MNPVPAGLRLLWDSFWGFPKGLGGVFAKKNTNKDECAFFQDGGGRV